MGGEDDDIILGEAGHDSMAGGAGIDALFGGEGNDTLDGGANPATGGDLLFGGAGSDLYLVDSPFDLVDEGNLPAFASYGFGGNDTIISKANFFWDLYSIGEVLQVAPDAANPGGLGVTLVGSVFSNLMIGSAATDIFFGRGGADTYRAGDGVDWMSLSTLGVGDAPGYLANGVNTVIVEPRQTGPFSYDIVFEYEPGYDKLDLSAYRIPGFATLMDRGVNTGTGSCYFALGDGLDYLYLVNVTLGQMRAADFIL